MTLPLFDDLLDRATQDRPGPSHAGGHATERAAAAANAGRSGSQRRRVLEAIAGAGSDGHTDFELERLLGLNRPSPGNRRGELVTAGLVANSGRTRKTNTGSPAVVWVLTDAGREVFGRLEGDDA